MNDNVNKNINRNRKYLIIFIVVVAIVAVSLTLIFKQEQEENQPIEKDNKDVTEQKDVSTIVDINNQDKEYILENGKIILKNFRVELFLEKWYLKFTARKLTDETINTFVEYKILLYDKNNKVLHEENGGILSGLLTEDMECWMKLDFDGELLDHIEFRRLSDENNTSSLLNSSKS